MRLITYTRRVFMKLKKINCVIALSILLCACSNTPVNKESDVEEYAVSSYITQEMIDNAETGSIETISSIEWTPDSLLDYATDVAIVQVVSLEKADMELATFVPMTYGEMLVNTPLRGNIEKGAIVTYAKPGGIISIADYEKADDPQAIEKRDYLRKQANQQVDKENEYYDILMGNDVKIEAGKTYLAYMTYHENINKYEIIGFGTGFREVNMPVQKAFTLKEYDLNDYSIKNNDTGEFESLSAYINENL